MDGTAPSEPTGFGSYQVNMNSNRPDLAADSSDRSLVCRFQKGEDDAATELYLRYAKRLLAFTRKQTSNKLASRFDPEDVIQSVFRTFFRRAAEGRFVVPAGDELWQLLLVIALNKVRRLGRFHQQQLRSVDRSTGHEALEQTAEAEGGPELQMLQLVIDEALEQLPIQQRRIVELRIQGYTTTEIAEKSHRCRRTVERVLRQFRDDISDFIETDHDSDSS